MLFIANPVKLVYRMEALYQEEIAPDARARVWLTLATDAVYLAARALLPSTN
jgi:hypothetical protein